MCVDHKTLVLGVGGKGGDRTGQVGFLGHTITNHHNFVKVLGGILQGDAQLGSSSHLLILVSNIGYGQLGALLNAQREVTVKVGNDATILSGCADCGTNDRLAGSVLNVTFDSDVLCKGCC